MMSPTVSTPEIRLERDRVHQSLNPLVQAAGGRGHPEAEYYATCVVICTYVALPP